MKYVDMLSSYLPDCIARQVVRDLEHEQTANRSSSKIAHNGSTVPHSMRFETSVLFADVSGFTKLSEAMNKEYGDRGAEMVAKHLNSYFTELVDFIEGQGGDVFKFAGDALIVLWPKCIYDDHNAEIRRESLTNMARRAAQAGLQIQRTMHNKEMAPGVFLSVKCGIGVGDVSIITIGGVYDRLEAAPLGEPLVQAFASEHHAVAGEVWVSPGTWKLIKPYFIQQKVMPDNFVLLENRMLEHNKLGNARLKRINIGTRRRAGATNATKPIATHANHAATSVVRSYVPGAVLPILQLGVEITNPSTCVEIEKWGGNELREVSIMFVNLGLKEHDLLAASAYNDAVQHVHNVFRSVQKTVYRYEGSINKFLMDDKGSTLIAVFGLLPLAHEDDAARAVLSSLLLCKELGKYRLTPSIGVTSGTVFCGIAGSPARKEYTVLGDVVNLAARLMQHVMSNANGGVLCSEATYEQLPTSIKQNCVDKRHINVKGKSESVHIYQPHDDFEYKRYTAQNNSSKGLDTDRDDTPFYKFFRHSFDQQARHIDEWCQVRLNTYPPIIDLLTKLETRNPAKRETLGQAIKKRFSILLGDGLESSNGVATNATEANLTQRRRYTVTHSEANTSANDVLVFNDTPCGGLYFSKLVLQNGDKKLAQLLSRVYIQNTCVGEFATDNNLNCKTFSDLYTLGWKIARENRSVDESQETLLHNASYVHLLLQDTYLALPRSNLSLGWLAGFVAVAANNSISTVRNKKYIMHFRFCDVSILKHRLPSSFSYTIRALEHIGQLYDSKKNGCILVSGGRGSGKSYFLQRILHYCKREPQETNDHLFVNSIVVGALAYERGNKSIVFCRIIVKIYALIYGTCPYKDPEAWQKMIADVKRIVTEDGELTDHSHNTETILKGKYDFAGARDKLVFKFIFYVLKQKLVFSFRENPLVICIDDLQYMHPMGFLLLNQLLSYGGTEEHKVPVLFICTMESVAKSRDMVIQPYIPQDFTYFVSRKNVFRYKIATMMPHMLKRIIIDMIPCVRISKPVWSFYETFSLNNPKLTIELSKAVSSKVVIRLRYLSNS